MNIVFYLMVVMAIIALWFLLAFVFKPFGNFLYRLFEDAVNAMEDKKEDMECKEKINHEE